MVVVGVLVSGMVITNSVSTPLGKLTKRARELSVGNIERKNDLAIDKMEPPQG